MIKLVIHCSDIHIRPYQRLNEYAEQLQKFVDKCKEIAEHYKREEIRILISGDLVHSKNDVSNELMTFASFSTVTGDFENIIGSMMDNFKISRIKAIIINAVLVFITSIPCVLDFNVLKNVHFIGDRDILGSEDFIVSNLLLPIGSLVFVFFCVTKYGWGAENFLEETNTGKGIKVQPWVIGYIKYSLPIMIGVIIVCGLL